MLSFPTQISNVFRDYVQAMPNTDDGSDSELVQAVECIAALSSSELVSQMVLFM